MPFEEGNQFWKVRSSHGRSPKYESSDQLWGACCEYFQWVEDNPLKEGKATQFQGQFVHGEVNKMRAMTMTSLWRFIGITKDTWYSYKERGDDFLEVITETEEIVFDQKFQGAAADLLNANIIARDLGLSDKIDNTHSAPGGGPIQTKTLVVNGVAPAKD